ncbi:MAG: elongation factor 4 [Candidatus Auribacter fodinae]|jgi:GTP-binding protein LepA|uniref:Elongation factor 4 n=1 Tax=Candidatus Auribacter fodinae TaxID=2093366 RepID=A0A3A4RCM1_9BACT|nr:MAG: elongation factor 4 [Candidatus Auribacter fodinae]
MTEPRNNIRNFSIIAHIDHGKSTLADRLLLFTKTISDRDFRDQVLDDMDLERERGITIKARAVRLTHQHTDGQEYILNLIDTPGHVDFSYEVSRSLAACEGALLIVDASQGVEAQTVANVLLAFEHNLEIIPVINKIDLPAAQVPEVKRQIEDVIGIPADEAILVSAKTGLGVEEVINALVNKIPPPRKFGDDNRLRALIFDSVYDMYRGVIVYIRVFSGTVHKGMMIRMMKRDTVFEVLEVGVFRPKGMPVKQLAAGEVGYVIANIKQPQDISIGDTITDNKMRAATSLPGFKILQPMVFCGMYPVDTNDYELLKDALEKLQLNDSAFHFEPETSIALGFGFRCGFLGLLHMEIIQERLGREYDIDMVATAPSVIYKVHLSSGVVEDIDNPVNFPDTSGIDFIEEPFIKATIICPNECIGGVMQLARDRRGECKQTETIDSKRVMITFEMPLAEVVIDFYDKLKSITRGYASMDYELIGYRESSVVKVDMLVNGDIVDAFSFIVHKDKAYNRGRFVAERLSTVIPRQLFQIAIQAAIGGKVIARETITALKKNVTAKCYGGDITRKRKLWEKQKEGKKRMKQIGKVQIPQNAFLTVLKMDE